MLDLVTLGELLVDFTESDISVNNQRLFEQNPGGAVANVACAAARLGIKTSFIGKVGNDMHGAFLASTLQDIGVNIDNLIMSDEVFTTLAFVALSKTERGIFPLLVNLAQILVLELMKLILSCYHNVEFFTWVPFL